MKKSNLVKIRLLRDILRKTKLNRVAFSLIIFYLIVSAVMTMVEPTITNYGDGLWYCFSAMTTIGFGDFVATNIISRILTIILCIFAIFTIALIPGVIASYYTERLKAEEKESIALFLDKLKRLPELSREELEEMSEKIKKLDK